MFHVRAATGSYGRGDSYRSEPILSLGPPIEQPGITASGLFSLILLHSNRLNPLESTACWMFFSLLTHSLRANQMGLDI